MSGAAYGSPSGNGADFKEITYSGDAGYSGEAKLTTSTWGRDCRVRSTSS